MIPFKSGIVLFLLFLPVTRPAGAQDAPADSMWTVELPVMVVTATRTLQRLRDTPVPARVVGRRDLERSGGLRLSDALSGVPGVTMIHAFGAGIQIQGFDPAYTLILVDGQPLIGRTAGTLDLDRLPVAGIERVEIVQGPSSSLYGQDALAGVVNIITQRPEPGFRLESTVRGQSFGTRDVNVALSGGNHVVTARVSANRLSTDGYDLAPDVPGRTGPGYTTGTTDLDIRVEPDANWSARLSGRAARTRRADTIGFHENGVRFTFEQDDRQDDWSVSPSLTLRPAPAHRIQMMGLATGYGTRSELTDASGTDVARFRQGMQRVETLYDYLGSATHLLTAGAGVTRESVHADRILGRKRAMETVHAFLQHQWAGSRVIQTTVSGRVDAHSEYGVQTSPKAAVMVRPTDALRIQASVGTGFKAPTFQQLYMDFTNPVAGYSVIGAADAGSALDSLSSIGQVQTLLADPSTFRSVAPERSVALNAAASWTMSRALSVSVTGFWNNVQDLIETLPVALKPNGQSIFTYVNLNRIRTRGLTVDLSGAVARRLEWRVGWQGLEAVDRDILDDIDAGRLFTRVGGVDRRLSRAEYGGLFNRSRHTLTMALDLERALLGADMHIRTEYRGRYGFGDRNGNLVLDADNEYVPGYWLWHITMKRDITPAVRMAAGIRNILNHTNPVRNPGLPGRQVFAGLSMDLES